MAGNNRKLAHKHETAADRDNRHRREASAARGTFVPLHQFNVAAWERMHREAEQATLKLGPAVHGRSGRV